MGVEVRTAVGVGLAVCGSVVDAGASDVASAVAGADNRSSSPPQATAMNRTTKLPE